MGALAFGFGDYFVAANDNFARHFTSFNGLYAIGNFARPTPLLPCLRGSCHEVTEGATSQLIIQLIHCPRNRTAVVNARQASSIFMANASHALTKFKNNARDCGRRLLC